MTEKFLVSHGWWEDRCAEENKRAERLYYEARWLRRTATELNEAADRIEGIADRTFNHELPSSMPLRRGDHDPGGLRITAPKPKRRAALSK